MQWPYLPAAREYESFRLDVDVPLRFRERYSRDHVQRSAQDIRFVPQDSFPGRIHAQCPSLPCQTLRSYSPRTIVHPVSAPFMVM